MLLACCRKDDALGLSIASVACQRIMDRDQQNRYELEHLWKARAEDAKAHLDRAAESLEELSENPETLLHADADTHSSAVRVYTEALEEFTNTSKVYQDLVLHGKIPDGN